jgi:hypothetical protein
MMLENTMNFNRPAFYWKTFQNILPQKPLMRKQATWAFHLCQHTLICLPQLRAEQPAEKTALLPGKALKPVGAHVYEDGIFADDFNVTPVYDDIVLAEKQPKQPASAIYNKRNDPCGHGVDFNVRNAAEAAAVPHIYHLFIA